MMSDNDSLKKILTWAGIVAAISIPVFLILKKKDVDDEKPERDFDSDIFSRELK
jgi:hypothetical protein